MLESDGKVVSQSDLRRAVMMHTEAMKYINKPMTPESLPAPHVPPRIMQEIDTLKLVEKNDVIEEYVNANYEAVPNNGQGNCQYMSVALQVKGSADKHMEARREVCDYIQNHQRELAPFSAIQEFSKCRSNGEWGNNVTLAAAAAIYKKLFVAIDPKTHLIYKVEPSLGGVYDGVLFLKFYSEKHYEAYRPHLAAKPHRYLDIDDMKLFYEDLSDNEKDTNERLNEIGRVLNFLITDASPPTKALIAYRGADGGILHFDRVKDKKISFRGPLRK